MGSQEEFPDHRKDLKSRSPNLGPYATKGTLKELPQGIYFLDPSGGLGVGVRIRGTLGDKDPLNKVPFKRATSRVRKGPL